MEQYLLQLPKRLAQEVREGIANGDSANVDMVAGADNKHFTLHVNGKKYPAKIAQLPTILETHKTYDDNFFYKSGEIGQIFVVTDKEEEKKLLEMQDEVPNGITPPNTNVIKRKYEKTKKTTPFPKPDVARVEEDLVKIIAGGVIEDVHEELVDFYDWMADDEHPGGITVMDEMELIREHPEYLTLSEEPSTKKQKLLPPSAGSSTVPGTANARDNDEDKEVDMLEDDILDGMDTKPASPPRQKAYLTDPEYLKLLPIRDRLQKSVRDADRDISELSAKVDANSNIIVKNRFKQMLETARQQRTEIAAELDKVKAEIADFESS
ncbi:Transcription initiation factor TFIID subunit 7 [Phytophthora nicotianae]|uniref:Transcription initiation factor TFIID subunit 7 n=1 Tax=Phytophthora nicotianae TaxID=4792 RepID=A0A0W8BXS1_PHYNI|nr:Transcription initiation factor TFIID subunit 7 [Phytophthora nicotianae]